jgi:hypothetical protein
VRVVKVAAMARVVARAVPVDAKADRGVARPAPGVERTDRRAPVPVRAVKAVLLARIVPTGRSALRGDRSTRNVVPAAAAAAPVANDRLADHVPNEALDRLAQNDLPAP